jgi:hemolysin D
MEPTNQPPVRRARGATEQTELDFLPDADAIERTPLPPSLRITLHLLLSALVIFVLWASLSQIDTIVTARGRLVNPLPNIVVQPLENAVIDRILVRVGQVVRKGEVLALLDPTFTGADDAQLRTRLASLETQVASLEAELGGAAVRSRNNDDGRLQARLGLERQANHAAQQSRLDQNIARLQASIETNGRDQHVLAQRLASLAQIEAMQEKLVAENFGAKMQLLEARDRRLEVERNLTLAHSRDTELARELAAARAERAALDKGWRQQTMETLLDISRERDGLREQLSKADRRHQLVQLTSPADAVVLEIGKLSPGSVARGAEAVFTLVPLGAQLEAEVEIDTIDVGYVRTGDPVQLKFDAFPFQKHGAMDGKLRTITQDAFRREQVAPGQRSEAYYLSRISFGGTPLRSMAPGARLLPGMTLSAEVVVGRRSVMSYLLWPLTKGLTESIREP